MASRFLETILIEDVRQIRWQMRYPHSMYDFCDADWKNTKNLLYIDIRVKGENRVEEAVKAIKLEKQKLDERGFDTQSAFNIFGCVFIGQGAELNEINTELLTNTLDWKRDDIYATYSFLYGPQRKSLAVDELLIRVVFLDFLPKKS